MGEVFKERRRRMEGRGDWPRRKQPRKKKKKNLWEGERVTLQELLEG